MSTLALNRSASRDYEFLKEEEGGLMLTGAEVKSVKGGHAQLKGAFLFVRRGELWLKNAYIAPYKPAGEKEGYDPIRDRKILIHKKELLRLGQTMEQQGLTMVPISLYTRGSLVKLKFALARGKKQYEKRESIKKRDMDRTLRERAKGTVRDD